MSERSDAIGGGTALLAALSAGNFAIGMGAFVVVGVLSPLAVDLGMSTGEAGALLTVYAVAYGFLSPLLIAATGGVDRRALLLAALCVFLVATLISALAPDQRSLFLARAVAAAGAGIFTPTAASVAFSASAPERHGRSLGLVFLGLTLSQALGVPVGAWIGYAWGWRAAFWVVVLLCAFVLPVLILLVPRGIAFQTNSIATLRRALGDWRGMASVLVTTSFTGASFILYTYVTPLLEQEMGFGRDGISLTLLVIGAGAVGGAWLGGALADAIGPYRAMIVVILVQAVTLPVFSVLPLPMPVFVPAMFVWSLFGWSLMVPQQARLVRQAPERQAVMLALNAAALYLGMAAGSGVAALLLPVVGLSGLGLVGALGMMVALAHLVLSERAMSGRSSAR